MNVISEEFMKKFYLFKILLLFFAVDMIAGCSSYTMPPGTKHWHGKNFHKIAKEPVSPPSSPGTVKHWHGKNLHKIETTQ